MTGILHEEELVSIINDFIRLFRKYNLIVKQAVDFNTGELLHGREIETILSIGMNPGIRSHQLCDLMGISKGAVSQVVNRLLRKHYLAKYPDPGSQKSFILRLSDKGAKVYDELGMRKHKSFEVYHKLYREANPGEIALVKKVLQTIDITFDQLLEEHKEKKEGTFYD